VNALFVAISRNIKSLQEHHLHSVSIHRQNAFHQGTNP
jgi:hypothetical protein